MRTCSRPTLLMICVRVIRVAYAIIHMGKNLLFQKPVVSEFGLFYIIFRLICQKFGLFFETTGFETTGFSPYRVRLSRGAERTCREVFRTISSSYGAVCLIWVLIITSHLERSKHVLNNWNL